MSTMRRRLVLGLALLAAVGAGGFGASGQAAAAQGAGMMPRTISVSGQGEMKGTPDQAQLSAGVVTQATTAAAATAANTTAMTRVFASLRMLGIPDNKIQTSNFSVQPQYPPFRPDQPEPRNIVGYQVSNQVTVVIDDVTKVGATLDALVRSGANQLGGISFSIANPKPLAEGARAAAVADAMAKARTLAAAAGVTLGPLLSIEEGAVFRPPMPFMARAELAAASPPVAVGEESVTVNVTMTYAIQ